MKFKIEKTPKGKYVVSVEKTYFFFFTEYRKLGRYTPYFTPVHYDTLEEAEKSIIEYSEKNELIKEIEV